MANHDLRVHSARRLCSTAMALTLLLVGFVAGTLPASAGPALGATSTTTLTVPTSTTSALAGVSVSGLGPDSTVQVIVSTDTGTLTIDSLSGLTLDFANSWSGDDSIGFSGSQSDVNAGLASLTLTTGSGPGTAQVNITALPNAPGYVYSPENGHFLQYIASPAVTWDDARTAALARSFLGQPGYLASLNTKSVNDVAANRIEGAADVFFGAESTDTPGAAVQRTWQWVDGPLAGTPLTFCSNITDTCAHTGDSGLFMQWAPQEPNNCCTETDDGGVPIPRSGEWVAVTNWGGGVGNWNDVASNAGATPSGYLVEYGDQVEGATSFAGLVSVTSSVQISDAPGAPTSVVASRGNGSATVVFTRGAPNGSTVTGYLVTSSPGGTVTPCPGSPCVISGLTNGTAYTFTVIASTADGSSAPSQASNSVVPATVPDPPTGVTAADGNGSATITFTQPASNGGSAVTSYGVTSAPGAVTANCAGSPCVITGLTNGTSYTFTLHATNDVGDSAESDASAPVTPQTVPDPPTAVEAAPGAGNATVTFVPPVNDGGTPVTGYTVTSAPGGLMAICTGSPCVVSGLTNGTAYEFTVRATNEIGDSVESDATSAVTPATVPDAPVNLEVTRGDGSATLEFLAPSSDGGSTIQRYEVSTDGGGTWATLSTSGTAPIHGTVSSLSNGTAYVIQVRAVNAVGAGQAVVAGSVTPARVPDMVVGVTGTRGDGQVTVAFETPADGGSPITGYTVTSQPGAIAFPCSVSPCVVTGLANGTAYTFRVHATNDVGDGEESAASSPVTPASVPTAATLTSVTSTAGALVLTFVPGSADGGAPVIGYEASTDGGFTWSPLTVSGSGPVTGTVAGLTNGHAYGVRVRAVNAVGGGLASNLIPGTPATVPGVPRAVTVVGVGSRATVRWTAPSFDGGSPITQYVVMASPGGQSCSSTSTSCVFPHLALGVRYTFSVVAINTAIGKTGTGMGAAAVSAPIRLSAVPGAPRALAVTPGDRTLRLTFFRPLSNGGSRITGYQASLDGGRTWQRLPASGASPMRAVVAPVLNGRSFTVLVRAVNANGAGPASAAVRTRTAAWFSDPVSAAAHQSEIAVPKHPKRYHGPWRHTRATARSRNSTIAYPDTRLAGRQLQAGQAVDLGGAAVFVFDSGRLSTKGRARVKGIASSLRYVTKVTCEGYADYAGSTRHENSLARQRAVAVCAAVKMYAKQVTTRTVRSYGNTRPVVVGGRAASRTANRRVVVLIR